MRLVRVERPKLSFSMRGLKELVLARPFVKPGPGTEGGHTSPHRRASRRESRWAVLSPLPQKDNDASWFPFPKTNTDQGSLNV